MAGSTSQQTGLTNGVQDKSSSESIDQVRDLLFGAQMRTVDARIQALEERLLKETAAIRAELRESVSTLDTRVSNELSRLTAQLQDDKLDRSLIASGLTDLANRISSAGTHAGRKAPTSAT